MSESKAELERVYTVPLSRAWIAPRHRRTRRAINILREYAEKHMKSSEIKIDTTLNEQLWTRGITKPPRRITVRMIKDEDGVVTVSLPKEAKPVAEETKETPTSEAKAEPKPEEVAPKEVKGPEPEKAGTQELEKPAPSKKKKVTAKKKSKSD